MTIKLPSTMIITTCNYDHRVTQNCYHKVVKFDNHRAILKTNNVITTQLSSFYNLYQMNWTKLQQITQTITKSVYNKECIYITTFKQTYLLTDFGHSTLPVGIKVKVQLFSVGKADDSHLVSIWSNLYPVYEGVDEIQLLFEIRSGYRGGWVQHHNDILLFWLFANS